MPKYDAMGNLYDVLGEECAEVAQAIYKARRFGLEGTGFRLAEGKPSPREMITQEVGDLLVIGEKIERVRGLDVSRVVSNMVTWTPNLTSFMSGFDRLLIAVCRLGSKLAYDGEKISKISLENSLGSIMTALTHCVGEKLLSVEDIEEAKEKKHKRLFELFGEE